MEWGRFIELEWGRGSGGGAWALGRGIIGVLEESGAGAKGVRRWCEGGLRLSASRHPLGDFPQLAQDASLVRHCSEGNGACGMEASEAKPLRALDVEIAKLKRVVADQMLDVTSMKDLLAKGAAQAMGLRELADGTAHGKAQSRARPGGRIRGMPPRGGCPDRCSSIDHCSRTMRPPSSA